MSDELTVTIAFVQDHYEVTASLTDTDVLPEAIFLYENLGTTQLGPYYGVCSQAELTTRQEFTGSPIAVFANKFVRYIEAFTAVPTEADAQRFKEHLVDSVKRLKAEVIALQPNTEVIEL